MGTEMYKVLIADRPSSRLAMRSILELDPLFQIAGEAGSGEETLRLAGQLRPDLVLMALELDGLDGLETTRRLKSEYPATIIVILSDSNDVLTLFEALKRGAQGYLLRSMHPASWHEYVRSLLVEDAPLSREIGFQILGEFLNRQDSAQRLQALNGPEQEMLRYLCEGCSNDEIAGRLLLSQNTVKRQIRDLLFKLHLKNRVQLVRYAYETGWAKPGRVRQPDAGQRTSRVPLNGRSAGDL